MSNPEILINEAKISEELARQAGHYMYYSEQAVKAEAMFETAKFKLEQTVATLDNQIRERAAEAGKKITETLIEKEVELNEVYKQAKATVIKTRAEMGMAKARREAWHQRSALLVQMAINQRNQLDQIASGTVSKAAA